MYNLHTLHFPCLCAQTNQTTHTSETPQTAASAQILPSHLLHSNTTFAVMSSSKKSSSSSSRKSRSSHDPIYESGSYSSRSYGTTYSSMSPFWTIGTLLGASSVALGAFGAHGLKQRIRDPALIASWGTAAQYQVHSLSAPPHAHPSSHTASRPFCSP
jgi:hypothetical protein